MTNVNTLIRNEDTWEHTGIQSHVISQIWQLAFRHGLRKVILFGSRGRGDYRRESDIDLAVSGGNVDLFRLDLEEETDTLLQYDVVDQDHHLQQGLRGAITKEGIVLYEKT